MLPILEERATGGSPSGGTTLRRAHSRFSEDPLCGTYRSLQEAIGLHRIPGPAPTNGKGGNSANPELTMALPTIDPRGTKAWEKLLSHYHGTKDTPIKELFARDGERGNKFSVSWEDFLVDYSKNRIDQRTMALLFELARECGLKEAMEAQFQGRPINRTEGRAVMHTALRALDTEKIVLDGQDIVEEVHGVRKKIVDFSQGVISGHRKGYTGKAFTDVVNIGIGGSDLGPVMVTEALKFYKNHLRVHFVSNVDGDHLQEVLQGLDRETTLFVVVSKTFTTQETLTNALSTKKWFLQQA